MNKLFSMKFIHNEKKILIRCDAGHAIGMGHLSRCCTLAIELRKAGYSPLFLMFDPSEAAREIVATLSFPLLCISIEDLNRRDLISRICGQNNIVLVIFDVMHERYIRKATSIQEQITALKLKRVQVLFIDEMDHNCVSWLMD